MKTREVTCPVCKTPYKTRTVKHCECTRPPQRCVSTNVNRFTARVTGRPS